MCVSGTRYRPGWSPSIRPFYVSSWSSTSCVEWGKRAQLARCRNFLRSKKQTIFTSSLSGQPDYSCVSLASVLLTGYGEKSLVRAQDVEEGDDAPDGSSHGDRHWVPAWSSILSRHLSSLIPQREPKRHKKRLRRIWTISRLRNANSRHLLVISRPYICQPIALLSYFDRRSPRETSFWLLGTVAVLQRRVQRFERR